MRAPGPEQSVRGEAKGRTRVVTFRVSGEEFGLLTRARVLSEARSLSSFARRAVLEKVRTMESPSRTLSGDLATLAKTLAELDGALRDVSKRIRRVLGLTEPETDDPEVK
ncbi:MAG: hypothetical protein LAQ30_11475 [Acidobacteriia bacterium]|nr:hypothetical protein [Terriglobia bacterium]